MINDGDKLIREHMDAVEHIAFDKEAAWGRLQERMQQKPAKKRISISLRWAAAAAILLLVSTGIALFSAHKHAPLMVTNIKPHITPAINNITPAPRPTVTITTQETKHNTRLQPQNTIAPALHTTTAISTAPEAPQNNVVATIEHNEPKAETPVPMAVVHINDLQDDERREWIERMESKSQYASGKRIFPFPRPLTEPSLIEDNTQPIQHRFLRPGITQN